MKLEWYDAPPPWRLWARLGWGMAWMAALLLGWFFPEVLRFILRMTLPV
jgi:hypothetical protein